MADLRTSWPRSFRKATALPPEEVGALIEALIAELDKRDGDPDLEDSDPCSLHTDERGNYLFPKDGGYLTEDDEEDDPAGMNDDDGYNLGPAPSWGWGRPQGAGCPISDPGGTSGIDC